MTMAELLKNSKSIPRQRKLKATGKLIKP